MKSGTTRIMQLGASCLFVLCLLGVALLFQAEQALAQTGNIDPTDKWAWETNAGWINFAPDNGGVIVYSDHLEGDAWGENIGWIRLGSYTGGGTHTYANTTEDDYGVNRDAPGNLSGYAWGTNVGWINFNPTHGGVTIDPITGSFDGYAWGENIGWIHFKNDDPAYNVVVSSVIAVSSGDVDGNGTVDVLDVRLCLQIALGVIPGTLQQRAASDVDSDGDVDMDDARILAEYIIGIRSALPGGG